MRRTSDNITRQSLRAIEGLSSQADMLKNVSENLLQQVSSVTNRFDNQGQSIVNAASALRVGQHAHRLHPAEASAELNDTLQRLSGKADQLDEVMRGYTATVEGSLDEAEARARHLIQQLAQGTVAHAQAAVTEVERLRSQTDAQSQAVVCRRALASAMRAAESRRARRAPARHRGHARRRCRACRTRSRSNWTP